MICALEKTADAAKEPPHSPPSLGENMICALEKAAAEAKEAFPFLSLMGCDSGSSKCSPGALPFLSLLGRGYDLCPGKSSRCSQRNLPIALPNWVRI